MELTKIAPVPAGAWDKLPTENLERKPKVSFEINIPVEVKFLTDIPREYQWETGIFYVFDVKVGDEEKSIVTSAWTLLRGLKTLTPMKNKRATIVKKIIKGKQRFEVTPFTL